MVKAMEIQKGFKQTEVGLIPNDWNVVSLGRISSITKLAGFEYSKHFNSYRDGGDIIVLRGTNITNNVLDLSDVKTISAKTSKNLPRSKLFKGDLVFAYVGTIGPVYFVEENDKFHLGPNTSKITLDETVDTKYIFNYFKSWLIRNEIFEHTSIGAQPSLSMSKIRKFRIIVPSLKAEQTAIANTLNDADALISQLEKLITKKRAVKQGAMQELLKPKEGWEEKNLGDCADVIGGGTPSSFNVSFWNGDINWFTPTEVGDSKYVCESVRKITKEGYANSSAKMLPIGTVLLTSRAGIGDLGILMNEGCTNQGFQSLIAKGNTDNEFLYYLMGTLKNQLHQNASGSTFLEISPGKLKQIEVIVPDKSEQTRIAQILSDMDAEIEALEKKLEKYKMIKQGMMQNLLTGRIRLV